MNNQQFKSICDDLVRKGDRESLITLRNEAKKAMNGECYYYAVDCLSVLKNR